MVLGVWCILMCMGSYVMGGCILMVNRLTCMLRVLWRAYSWQNGTKCRDGVNMLWCHFHLLCLVFEGSISTCACFHSETFFVICCVFCFWLVFVGMVGKREAIWEGRLREDASAVKYESI